MARKPATGTTGQQRSGVALPDDLPGSERKTDRPRSTRPAKAKPATAASASVTPGQERPIPAAFEAGPTPAATAREVRVGRGDR